MELAAVLATLGTRSDCPCAVFIKDGKILTGLRHYSDRKIVWTLPAGRCEPGETLEVALRREVAEEIGITDLQISEYIGEVVGANPGDLAHLFVCESNQMPELKEPEKFSDWKWIEPSKIQNFITRAALDRIIDYVGQEEGSFLGSSQDR